MFFEQIKPEHEYRHQPDDDLTFNESTYYNFTCPTSGVAGWVRVAIQANQPASQAGIMLFLRDGECLFDYRREATASAVRLEAAGLEIAILEPHARQRLTFTGELRSFADPRVLVEPGGAFRTAPRRMVVIDLDVEGQGHSFGTNGEDPDHYVEETMALGHFEQFIAVRGTIRIEDREVAIDARGLRDHSWGPRDWAGPLWYRWPVAALDDGTLVMALAVGRRDGRTTREGAVLRDGELSEARLESIDVEWTDDGFGRRVVSRMSTPGGPLVLTATAREPQRYVPLRHRRSDGEGNALHTRIGYCAYDFATDDGRTGHGMVEILDQMVDGLPQGMAVAPGPARA